MKYTLLALAFVASVTSATAKEKIDFNLGRNMEILVNLMHSISTQYVDKVDADEMAQNAAAGVRPDGFLVGKGICFISATRLRISWLLGVKERAQVGVYLTKGRAKVL